MNVLQLSKLNETERLEIATLLIKAGYTVRMRKEKTTGRNYNYYIEYWKGEESFEGVLDESNI